MSRALEITDSQRQSSDRHDLRAAIYLLSGTFVGRGSVPNVPFYWSTQTVSALGQQFKAYIAPPQSVSRGMGFEPGSQGTFPEVRIPVRNLPFAHSESVVAAITDEDFRIENTTATLRVAYLRPGQTPADLAAADWTPLVLDGFIGPADEVTLDGLVLPLFNRGARRNQMLAWPRLPSPETMSGGAIDANDAGTIPPIIVGNVRSWVKVPTLNLGVRGFTSSGFDAGSTEIRFSATTVGSERLTSSGQVQIHYLYPVYSVVSATFDSNNREFVLFLASGLAADVPRGAYVQQWGPGINPSNGLALGTSPVVGNVAPEESWFWALGAGTFLTHNNTGPGTILDPSYKFGWRFSDGEVRPADVTTWPIALDDPSSSTPFSLSGEGGRNLGDLPARATRGHAIGLYRGSSSAPNAPVYYDPLANVAAEVQTQPEFTQTIVAIGAINRPTGGTGPSNSVARDGSEDTGIFIFDAGDIITLSFNSAPSPFADGDTTDSTLHIVMQGDLRFTDGAGSVEFTDLINIAGRTSFHIHQAAARDFNASVRVTNSPNGGSNGGTIYELWWEHSMSAEVSGTRTQDVTLVSASVPVGPVMQFADLVMQPPVDGTHLTVFRVSGATQGDQPLHIFREGEDLEVSGSNVTDLYVIPYPSTIMVGLHALLGATEGDWPTINSGSYRAAHNRFIEHNIRLGFVWDETNHPSSWSDIETMVGEQSRSFMFYGPSGHEILFMEAASGLTSLPIVQSFRLPGCPGTNTLGGSQALYSRTLTTELVNVHELQWDPNPLTGDYRRTIQTRNEESIADIGVRRSDRGAATFSLHTPWEANARFAVAEAVSGIGQFYVDRQAFAATRFAFDTAWIAHGLDRGSMIHVSYPVSNSPLSFRNVIAEVEQIEVSPLDGERFSVTARSVTKPQKGLAVAYTWVDVFTEEDDAWTTRILQEFDTWQDYWSTP